MPKPTDERSPSEPTKRMAEILGAEWVERSLGEGLRAFLLASWDRIYGDCIGWTAFKAAVDEGRYDDALDSLTRPAADDALREAAEALIADVRRRYPGEELRCEYMRALDAALSTNAEKR